MFKTLAYEVLSNPEKRSNYDQTGDPERSANQGFSGNPFGGFGVNPIFFSFGGGFNTMDFGFSNMRGGSRCVTKRTCDSKGNCKTIRTCS